MKRMTTDFTDYADKAKAFSLHPCNPRNPWLFSCSMLHENITQAIIGASILVLNELKPGLDEKHYENALVIELRSRGHVVDQQREFPVYYRGHLIGTLIPDLIVDGSVIADPKVVTAFNDTHIAQMLGYLAITRLEVALLISFKEATLRWKRVLRHHAPLGAETDGHAVAPLTQP